MDQTLRRVAVIGGLRTPFCRSNTLYADQSNLEMLIAVLNGLVDKYKLAGAHIDEVVGGAVVSHSKDWNLAREAVLGTKLAHSTPGITMQQACGTSLQAAMSIAAKIATGADRERHRHGLRYDLGCAHRRSSRSSRIAWWRRRTPGPLASASRLSRASRQPSWRRSRPR